MNPLKAIHHPKLPDQKQVKRIFDEIESKDERLELNLYIVGEGVGDPRRSRRRRKEVASRA